MMIVGTENSPEDVPIRLITKINALESAYLVSESIVCTINQSEENVKLKVNIPRDCVESVGG